MVFTASPSAVCKLLFPDGLLYLLSAALLASFAIASCEVSFPSCPSLSHYAFVRLFWHNLAGALNSGAFMSYRSF